MDPATGTEGLYDILIDGDRIASIGLCGSLDEMAREAVSMKLMYGVQSEELKQAF